MLERSKRVVRVLGVGVVLLTPTFFGCSDNKLPITPEQASETAQKNSREQIQRVSRSITTLADSKLIDAIDSVIGANNECGTVPASGPLAQGEEDLRGALDELVQWLEDHVFRPDRVESEDGTHVIYRIQPEDVCDETDEGCVAFLTDHPIRLNTSSPSEGDLDIEILVGEARRPVAQLKLYRDTLAARVSLGELKKVVEEMTAGDANPPALPQTLSGTIELALVTHGTDDVELRASVLEPVRVVADLEMAHPAEITIARANPIASVRLRGADNRASITAGVNALDAVLPAELICNDPPPGQQGNTCGTKERTGRLGLHVAGIQGTLELDGDSEQIVLRDAGLGDEASTLKLDSDTLASLELNRDHGRKFDATVRETAGGIELTIKPAIDLKLALALTHLSESMKVDLPDFLMDELFEVMLGGPPQARLLIPRDDPCAPSGQTAQRVEVLEGKLELSATSLTQPTIVDAGQCVLPTEQDGHFFEQIEGGTCE